MTIALRKTIILAAIISSLLWLSACSKETTQDPAPDTSTAVNQNGEGQDGVGQSENSLNEAPLNEEAQTDESQSEKSLDGEAQNKDALLQEAQSKSIKEASDQPAQIGEWLNYHGLVIRVDSIRESAGDDYLKPQEGNTIKVLNLTVVNIGDKKQVISSAIFFRLTDDSGTAHMPVVTSDITQSLDAELEPGQVLQGEIPYEVSKDAKDLKLSFSDPLMEGEASWSLK